MIRGLLSALLIALAVVPASAAAQAPASGAESPPPGEAAPPTPTPPPVTKLPELLRFVEAEYPPEARAAGLQGSVLLQLDVNELGQVTAVEVLEPAGHGFDEAARTAATQFVFSPAESEGTPIPVRILYRYHFVLRREEPPSPPQEPRSDTPPAGETTTGQAAGPVNLSGRVLEAGTRLPLEDVSLSIEGTELSATTDAAGRFELRGVPIGPVTVKVSLPRYEGRSFTAGIEEGRRTEATWYLRRRADQPYAMEVSTRRETDEVVQHSVEIEEVRRIPGTFGDAVRVIQNLPGVARAPFGLGFLIVRGTAPNDTGTYIDGMRVPILFHFGGLVSVFSSALLDRVDYLPGGFSVRYGRSLGGVVNLETRSALPERLHGIAEVDLLNSAFFLEAPIGKKLGVSVSARRSYIDFLANPILENTQGLLVRFPRYWDAQLKLEWHPGPRDRIQVMAFASDDRFRFLGQAEEADEASQEAATFGTYVTAARLKGRWLHTFSDRVSNRLDLSAGSDSQNVQFGEAELSLAPFYVQVRDELEARLSSAFRLRGGLDLQIIHYNFDIDIPAIGDDPTVSDVLVDQAAWGLSPSPYLEAEITIGDQLKVIPGVRFDPLYVFDQYWDWSFDPRVAFRSQVSPTTVIKGSFGRYSQPPQPQQFFEELGEPSLTFEHALQSSLGLEQAISPKIHLDLVTYYNALRDLVRVGPGGGFGQLFDDEDEGLAYVNDGLGRSFGLELLLRHDFTDRFFGWLSYTFSRTERWDPEQEEWRLFTFDQPHIVTLLGSYRLPKRWEIAARFRFTSGLPYTPVVNAYQRLEDHAWFPVYGETDSARNGPFHALDIRVQKEWVFNLWRLQAYIDVQNIYNRANPEASFYSFDFRDLQLISGLPILPVLGVRGEF